MRLLFSILFLIFSVSLFAEKPIKLKACVHDMYYPVENALTFVYEEDSMILYLYTDQSGVIDLKLDRNTHYTITISKKGYSTSSIIFDTHDMKDSKDVNEIIDYTVKWNYVMEKFESFNYNMGWKVELEEM